MIPYKSLYLSGRHRYTHEELQASLKACGFIIVGQGWDAQLDGSEELLREAQGLIDLDKFLGDWDSDSQTGAPNWHAKDENGEPACPCPACQNRGGIPRTSPTVSTRVWPEEKDLLHRTAQEQGKSFNEWAREVLLAACS